MHRFFDLFAPRDSRSPEAASTADTGAERAPPGDEAQASLPLDLEPVAPRAAPHPVAGSASRALRAAGRPSMSVAVRMHHLPAMPAPAQAPTTGPVLTETERVRLRIMQAQIRLAGLALYEGPIDGLLSLPTTSALRYFQTLKGLPESGLLTIATLRALGVPTS